MSRRRRRRTAAILAAGAVVAVVHRTCGLEARAPLLSLPMPRTQHPWRQTLLEYLGMAGVLAALAVVFSLLATNFLTLTTFRTIANQIPAAVIVATGMTLVLISGGIDLSVGSIVALSAAVLGVAMVQLHLPLALAVLLTLAAGTLCGLVNGLVVALWRIPPFIVTLGMMEIARGGAYLVTNSETKYIGSAVEGIASTALAGISFPFVLAVLIVALAQAGLLLTAFGRHVTAVGSNEEVARLSGIDPRWAKLKVYVLSGLLCAVAAVINTSRMSAADPNAGTGFELAAIAAVVIGGTSLMGGRGSAISSFFGVLIIAVLGAGLAQVGAQEPAKRLITGLVIVIAVVADHYRQRIKRPRGGVTP